MIKELIPLISNLRVQYENKEKKLLIKYGTDSHLLGYLGIIKKEIDMLYISSKELTTSADLYKTLVSSLIQEAGRVEGRIENVEEEFLKGKPHLRK
jgi:hypothetical protein